jgi:hypothetical protein
VGLSLVGKAVVAKASTGAPAMHTCNNAAFRLKPLKIYDPETSGSTTLENSIRKFEKSEPASKIALFCCGTMALLHVR